MMNLYLTCLVVGGVFIIITVMFGADTDADVDMDFDVDADVDMDFDMDADMDFDGSTEVDTDVHGDTGDAVAETISFLSVRNMVFLVAFFGLTGSLLTWMNMNPILTFITSLMMGLTAATLMHKTMNYLIVNEVDGSIQLENLVGTSAKVLVNVGRQNKGKISVHTNGQLQQFLALVAEEASMERFAEGEAVIILRVVNGTAHVVEKEFV